MTRNDRSAVINDDERREEIREAVRVPRDELRFAGGERPHGEALARELDEPVAAGEHSDGAASGGGGYAGKPNGFLRDDIPNVDRIVGRQGRQSPIARKRETRGDIGRLNDG